MSSNDALYKILAAAAWEQRQPRDRLPWSEVDRNDGFLHLSSATQVHETARRHFASARHLVLVRLDAAALSHLRWEVSRGGERFPHVYGDVSTDSVVAVTTLVDEDAGDFAWPEELREDL